MNNKTIDFFSIISVSTRHFEDESHSEIIEKFSMIDTCYDTFESNSWQFVTKRNQYFIDFSRYGTLRSDVLMALKYLVVKDLIDRDIDISTVYSKVNRLIDMLLITDTMNIAKLDEFKDFMDYSSNKKNTMAYYAQSLRWFLEYFPFNDASEYLSILDQYKATDTWVPRLLPNYNSVLIFNMLINKFFEDDNVLESTKIKYYPLRIWWGVSTIIPLRPIEICLLKIDCISCDKKDNKWYLEVPRVKSAKNATDDWGVEHYDKLEIIEEIYNMINKHRENASLEQEFLFSYSDYLHAYNPSNKKYSKYNVGFFNTYQLQEMLKSFYREIIEGYYNYTTTEKGRSFGDKSLLERMSIGDTRHYAFCNLMLQGFNPYLIAKLGGHKDIHTQMGYSRHLETFQESNIDILTRQFKEVLKVRIQSASTYINVLESRPALLKKIINELQQAKDNFKVKGGLCKSNNFPNECILDEDCIVCDFFIPDMSDSEYLFERANVLYEKSNDNCRKNLAFLAYCYNIDLKKVSENDVFNKQIAETNQREMARLGLASAYLELLDENISK